jgi:hypothetical protein
MIGLDINGVDFSKYMESNEALIDSGTSLFLINDGNKEKQLIILKIYNYFIYNLYFKL